MSGVDHMPNKRLVHLFTENNVALHLDCPASGEGVAAAQLIDVFVKTKTDITAI